MKILNSTQVLKKQYLSVKCRQIVDQNRTFRQRLHGIGSIWNRTQMGTFRPCVYTGPAGTVPNGAASRTQMGPLTKAIPFGTVPRKVSCKRVERFQTGTARKFDLIDLI